MRVSKHRTWVGTTKPSSLSSSSLTCSASGLVLDAEPSVSSGRRERNSATEGFDPSRTAY